MSPHRTTPLEQPARCQRVATLDRVDPGGAQQLSRPCRQFSRPLVVPAQPLSIVGGLLQVVADDLLVFDEPIACCPLLVVGEALMELRSLALGQRGVGGVADEDVPEPIGIENVRRRSIGPDDLPAHD